MFQIEVLTTLSRYLKRRRSVCLEEMNLLMNERLWGRQLHVSLIPRVARVNVVD